MKIILKPWHVWIILAADIKAAEQWMKLLQHSIGLTLHWFESRITVLVMRHLRGCVTKDPLVKIRTNHSPDKFDIDYCTWIHFFIFVNKGHPVEHKMSGVTWYSSRTVCGKQLRVSAVPPHSSLCVHSGQSGLACHDSEDLNWLRMSS